MGGPLYTPDATRGTNFLEAVIPGPFSCSWGLILPDRGFRRAHERVTFPGPNRVRLGPYEAYGAPGAGALSLPVITPGLPLGTATGAPDLQWETGGDAPWMGEKSIWSGEPSYAVSGTIIPGEHSWIQATVNGPGVLRWRILPPPGGGSAPPGDSVDRMTVDDAVVPGAIGGGYLHLPAGPQRVRWWHSSFPRVNWTGTPATLKLAEVKFEPPPSPSLQEITGLVDTVFHYPRHEPVRRPEPLRNIPSPPWGDLKVWTPVTADGRSAVRLSYGGTSPAPVPPSPGAYVVTSMARTEDPSSPYQNSPNGAWGPHPWMPKTFRARAGDPPDLSQLITDTETLLDSAVWRPAEETGLAEALDTPGREWTSHSNGFGAWRGYTWPNGGNGPGTDADPDFVQCQALTAGTEAWMETSVTGPSRVRVTWDEGPKSPQFPTPPVPAPLEGFQILVDGAEALRNPLRNYAAPHTAEVSVPAGVHTVRLRWGPFASDPVPLVISRVAITPETSPGVDIGALVEAPELPWYAQGGTGVFADTGISHDGTDSARLEFPTYLPGSEALVTTVTGPGVFRAHVLGEPKIEADGLTHYPAGAGDSQGFQPLEFALRPGRQVIRFQKHGSFTCHLDAVNWNPLPALSAEAALAAVTSPPGSSPALPAAFKEGTSYIGYPEDGAAPESVLIPEGSSAAVWIRVPVPCRITLSARALSAPRGESSILLIAGPESFPVPADSWRTLTFTSDDLNLPDGWLILASEGGLVLMDDLVVTPYDGNAFLPSMATANLTGTAAGINADPDGDGLVNLLEHAFGRDPARNDTARGVDGMPEVSTFRNESDGLTYLRVRFRGRRDSGSPFPPVTYTVETSAGDGTTEGNPPRWTAAGGALTVTPVTGSPGWADMEWRSATPVTAESRLYVRVRANAR